MDPSYWDDRYGTEDYVWTAEPNRFLTGETADLPVGRALDLACGEGRNAVWLAQQGWMVTGVDFSDAGLDKGRRMAAERGVDVDWVCADVTTWSPPRGRFDLVAAFYLQVPADERRRALAAAWRALAPGGILLVVAHDSANLVDGTGGPQDPAVLYRPDDVLADVQDVGAEVTVERAETVERTVADAERPALDCLVRLRRRA